MRSALLAFVVLAILDAAVSSSQPPETESHQGSASKHDDAASSDGNTANEAPTVREPTSGAASQPNTNTKNPTTEQEWWKQPWASDWTLVGVTILYVCVAIATLCAISRQADIAERNITQLERPWIRVRFNEREIVKVLTAIHEEISPLGYAVPLKYSFENDGRSPALVFRVSMNFKFIHDPEPDEATEPPYDATQDFPEVPVGPLRRGFIRQDKRYFGTNDIVGLLKGTGSLRFFCLIKYRDVFGAAGQGAEHETRFSWGWRTVQADEAHRAQGFNSVLQSKPMGGRTWNRYT